MSTPRAIHPGEYLRGDLEAAGVDTMTASKGMAIPRSQLEEVIAGKRNITPVLAMKIGRYFGSPARLWLQMQMEYDLARAEACYADTIRAKVTPLESTPCS